jgi:glycosyltransferase involved in cell wall biosynthesis
MLESLYLKFYRNTKATTISDSSKKDLIKYANINKDQILVLDNQIDFKPINQIKEKDNYIIFCGRLNPSKRPDEVIKALAIYLNKINNTTSNKDAIKNKSLNQSQSSLITSATPPSFTLANNINNKSLKLIIIGEGDEKYKNYLKNLVKKLNLENNVEFAGSISNEKRNQLMQKALAIIVTSIREGWGLIVTEANANGTIAITYDIEGLRDANSNKIGIITKINTPEAIAESIDLIIKSPKLRQSKEHKALAFANAHSNWDNQVRRMEKWIKK